MISYRAKAEAAAGCLRPLCPAPPRIGILTGTGLGDIAGRLEAAARIDYENIPYYPRSTVESHAGRMVLGKWRGRPVMVMQGRCHLYEGYTPREVAFPVRVMQTLGVRILVVLNAAGGLRAAFSPGEVMVISDHLNLTGQTPLAGANEDDWGVRFPDMSAAYDRDLHALALTAGRKAGLSMRAGVYAGLSGPSLETPAEVRYLQAAGADAVGFSTVMEVLAAVHANMRVLGLSILTNVHRPDRPEPASVEDIIALAQRTAPHLEHLLDVLMEDIDD